MFLGAFGRKKNIPRTRAVRYYKDKCGGREEMSTMNYILVHA
jgi:hypothetical protein